ncbi:MAG: dienelactone hydrolase family protein [Alphaproteobacteria bacterium]
MSGQTITLTAADGHSLSAYRSDPEGEPRAGLVVIQEIFGVNAHMRSVTDRFADEGYAALAPAMFDRVERGVEMDYDADSMAHGRELRGRTTLDQIVLDVNAAVDAVSAAGKVGVVGYCWGGSIAWLAAARSPVDAAVGYYGGQVHELRGETPRCPVMLHFGEEDHAIPLSDVDEVKRMYPDVPIYTYAGAGHGFNCEVRASYHPDAALAAQARTLAFFGEHLG